MPARPNVGTATGGVNVDVAPGATGTWAGPVTGVGSVTKVNSGTFVLSNPGNTYTGNTTVSAGIMRLDATGSFANSPTVTVGAVSGPILDVTNVTGGANFDPSLIPGGSFSLAFGQTLKGAGTVSGKTAIKSGSTVAPGVGIGTLNFDSNVAIDGTYQVEASSSPAADRINLVNGANLSITSNSVLLLSPGNTYDNLTPLTIAQLDTGTISGTFGSVQNLPAGYSVQYLSNSILLSPVPEPGSLIFGGLAAAASGLGYWRRRRQNRG
jgi:autotransporter-associated beta strand protein